MAKKAKIVPIQPVAEDCVFSMEDIANILQQTLGGNPQMLRRVSKVKPSGKKGLKVTYQFKIKLRGASKPPVWRRVLIPAHFTFSGLHAVIQEAFGWWNEHLYCYGDVPYGRAFTIAEPNEADWEDPDYNARTYTMSEFFGDGETTQKICYVYDFGDDWIHDIVLEKTLSETTDHATCTAGKGFCPEEDCGGIWGYEEMKESGEIDAHDFDIDEVNEGVEALPATGYEPW